MLHMTSSPRKVVGFFLEVARNVSADRDITSFAYFEFVFSPIFPYQTRDR